LALKKALHYLYLLVKYAIADLYQLAGIKQLNDSLMNRLAGGFFLPK